MGGGVAVAGVGAAKERWAAVLRSRCIRRRAAVDCSMGVGQAFHQVCGLIRRIITPGHGGGACGTSYKHTWCHLIPPKKMKKKTKRKLQRSGQINYSMTAKGTKGVRTKRLL